MSHIHLPDGIIPHIWWILGFVICFLLLWLFAGKLNGDNVRKKIPFAGVIGALMLIFMSVPLGFLPVHLSLAVLCGILAGPGLSFIGIFVVNTILALMGHGGFSTIGLNTLLMGGEAILGFYLFRFLTSRKLSYTLSAVFANVTALLLSTFLMVVIVATSVGISDAFHLYDHDPANDQIKEVQSGDFEDVEESIDNGYKDHEADDHTGEVHDHKENEVDTIQFLSVTGWGAVIIIITAGILIESLVTGLIVQFFSKVRPDLLRSNN